MTVIDLQDYRQRDEPNGPCVVSFYSAPFKVDGQECTLCLNVRVENGDYLGIINAFQEGGGRLLQDEANPEEIWFLPWPCAAVRVTPAG